MVPQFHSLLSLQWMSETSRKTGIPKMAHHVDGHFSKAQEHIPVLPEFRRGGGSRIKIQGVILNCPAWVRDSFMKQKCQEEEEMLTFVHN